MLTAVLLLALSSCIFALKDGDMELVLVQAIWRHGDRSPRKTFKTDTIKEDDWKFGGGGFSQLSPRGMKQHLALGQKIRHRYVDTGFLSEKYKAAEIYIRSSDLNRTIISAMSNMVGMYGYNNKASERGIDYPEADGWPSGFVPIAVHTIDRRGDYVVIANAPCDRRDRLWKKAKELEEVKAYLSQEKVVNLLKQMTINCGQEVNEDNLWEIRDTLLIEQDHFNETLRRDNKWFTDELYQEMGKTVDQIERYKNGIFKNSAVVNGVDIGVELKKVRGGSMLNELSMHMNSKLSCMKTSQEAGCKWINGLKYYAYSGHDTTLYAFLTAIGVVDSPIVIPNGYTKYSAAVFVELWINAKDQQPYFKVHYHTGEGGNITDITQEIEDCKADKYCTLSTINSFAKRIRPTDSMDKFCNIDPFNEASSTTTRPNHCGRSTFLHVALFLLLVLRAAWSA